MTADGWPHTQYIARVVVVASSPDIMPNTDTDYDDDGDGDPTRHLPLVSSARKISTAHTTHTCSTLDKHGMLVTYHEDGCWTRKTTYRPLDISTPQSIACLETAQHKYRHYPARPPNSLPTSLPTSLGHKYLCLASYIVLPTGGRCVRATSTPTRHSTDEARLLLGIASHRSIFIALCTRTIGARTEADIFDPSITDRNMHRQS